MSTQRHYVIYKGQSIGWTDTQEHARGVIIQHKKRLRARGEQPKDSDYRVVTK